MTNPFIWQQPNREVPKAFRPRNDQPGKLPPIVLPNSSKYLRPKEQKK